MLIHSRLCLPSAPHHSIPFYHLPDSRKNIFCFACKWSQNMHRIVNNRTRANGWIDGFYSYFFHYCVGATPPGCPLSCLTIGTGATHRAGTGACPYVRTSILPVTTSEINVVRYSCNKSVCFLILVIVWSILVVFALMNLKILSCS